MRRNQWAPGDDCMEMPSNGRWAAARPRQAEDEDRTVQDDRNGKGSQKVDKQSILFQRALRSHHGCTITVG